MGSPLSISVYPLTGKIIWSIRIFDCSPLHLKWTPLSNGQEGILLYPQVKFFLLHLQHRTIRYLHWLVCHAVVSSIGCWGFFSLEDRNDNWDYMHCSIFTCYLLLVYDRERERCNSTWIINWLHPNAFLQPRTLFLYNQRALWYTFQ